MKKQDFRFGNLVNYNEGGISQVIGVHQFGLDVMDEDLEEIYMEYENFSGIPITEEWLLKFGFEKVADRYRLKKGWHWIEVNKFSYYIDGKQYGLIDYVHQLQNLYHALTGEELNENRK
jgi:hypothetical protein